MQVYKFEPHAFASNSFAVTQDGKNCILIDCGEEDAVKRCERQGLKIGAVLLTHGHFDHVGGCAAAAASGAKIFCGEKEANLIYSSDYLDMFGGVSFKHFELDGTLKEGEYDVCGFKVRVIETPGHTAGGVTYAIENCLFTGDTLFEGSVGRSDLPTGDWDTLVNSVRKLYALSGDYKVYCGHGEDTTLNSERKYNQFVRE